MSGPAGPPSAAFSRIALVVDGPNREINLASQHIYHCDALIGISIEFGQQLRALR